jgi:hypothetical protein
MSEHIFKPYAVISEEWAILCQRIRDAQHRSILAINKYPNDDQWSQYLARYDDYVAIQKEMDDYRKTVRIAD